MGLIPRIGFIGLGSMGKPMAANLLKNGFSVTVTHHRDIAPALELEKMGADRVQSVDEIAKRCNVVITILPADKEMMDVYLNKDGLLNHLAEGSVCIEMTSSKPQTVKEIDRICKDKNIHLLDAPVSGGVSKASSGDLTLMVGGDRKIYEQNESILKAMGSNIYYTGEMGSGKAVKMINQFLNAGNTYIASEALFLAKELDLDLDMLFHVISESSGGSYVFNNAVKKAIIPQNFDDGFKLDLMEKDIGIAHEQAKQDELNLPALDMIYKIYQEISEQGYGDKHYAVVSHWVDQQNKE